MSSLRPTASGPIGPDRLRRRRKARERFTSGQQRAKNMLSQSITIQQESLGQQEANYSKPSIINKDQASLCCLAFHKSHPAQSLSSHTFPKQNLSISALGFLPLASSPPTSLLSYTLWLLSHTSPQFFTLSIPDIAHRKDAFQACYQRRSLICYRLCPVQ